MDLESRVDYLERQNRWMKAAILAIALIAVAMGQFRRTKVLDNFKSDVVKLIGEYQESLNQEVRSQRFTLVNDSGKVQGLWSVFEGKSQLTLRGTESKSLLAIGASDDSCALEIVDAHGKHLVSLNAEEHAGSLLIRGPKSRATAFLRVGVTGPELSMTNNEGNRQPIGPW